MEKLKDIDTFYSQKVIPLAFNESLSYMEQICNLISYIENTLVPTLNEHTDAINNLQAYVKMLKDLLDKLDKKVDDNFTTLNTKIDTTKEELNTKIDTTKEELNTKIDTTKEELTNIINGINETLTNSINDLDTKVINHINESNERFNNINTQIGSINNNIETINRQIESINTNVTQNTNNIMDLEIAKVKKISSYNSLNWRRANYYTNFQNYDSTFIYNKYFFLFVPLTNIDPFTTYIHFYDITEYPNLKNFVYLNIPDEIINIYGVNKYIPDFPVNYIMVEKSRKEQLTWEEAQTLPVYKAKLHIDTNSVVSLRDHTLTFFDKTPEELSNKNIYVMNPVFGIKL